MDTTHAGYVRDAYAERDKIVRSIARRFDDDAEGVVAEAYAQCCEADVRDEDHAARWVARAATHLAIDATRAHTVARRYAPKLAAPGTAESAEDRYLETELHRRVASAVEAMPPDQREVMQAYAEGFKNGEIAKRVGRSVYAVKHVIARSLKQLREQLHEAELALIAFCARRRRATNAAVVVSPSMIALLPAAAVAVCVAVPVAGQRAALILRLHHDRMGQAGYSTAYGDEESARSPGLAIMGAPRANRAAAGSDPSDAVAETRREVARRIDVAVDRVPPAAIEVGPEDQSTWAKPRDGAPSRAEYEPDPDDPVGDLTYCVTHPVITPERVYCEQPPR
ncbi:MAG TPA: sigma-70 family RNA polymerase sigma factor [Frankiaceae bacterium]|nr:sigma-70 family RNA polymerase sigma factor [Frankiaceae bacterium]